MSLPTPNLGADSPFIPETNLQFAWDSVSLTAAMACWRRYQYLILEGLQPKGPSRAIALQFGIAFHKGLELYHKARADKSLELMSDYDKHIVAQHEAIVQLLQYEPYLSLPTQEDIEAEAASTDDNDDGISLRNAKVRTRYHLMRALVWYLEHYADDQAKTLLLPSGEPAVEVSFRIHLPVQVLGHDVLLVGHIDRMVEFNERLYVKDYKTTKGLSRQWFADFELSHQLSGYTAAGQVILDRPVSGAIVDGIALQVGGVQFQRGFVNKTEGQLNEYFETVQNTLDEAERHADTGEYPMNTSACYFCQFKELCRQPPEFRESYKAQLFDKVPAWNPLENR